MSEKRRLASGGQVRVRGYQITSERGGSTPVHWHGWDQLMTGTNGSIEVLADAASWLVPPRGALWIPAGTRHAEQVLRQTTTRTLYFAARMVRRLPRRCARVTMSPLLHELMAHTCALGRLEPGCAADARLTGVLIDQLAEDAGAPVPLPLPRDARAVRVAAMLRDNPRSGAPVSELARRAGASARTIERLFVSDTRQTIGEWRRRLRLQHAAQLLASGAAVAQVARGSGYASTSAFIAAFKRAFGTTPGQY